MAFGRNVYHKNHATLLPECIAPSEGETVRLRLPRGIACASNISDTYTFPSPVIRFLPLLQVLSFNLLLARLLSLS